LFPCPSWADLEWGNFALRVGRWGGLRAKAEGRAEGKIKGTGTQPVVRACLHVGLYDTGKIGQRVVLRRRPAPSLVALRAVLDWLRCGTTHYEATKRALSAICGHSCIALDTGHRSVLVGRFPMVADAGEALLQA
jgi:hypothetical protein